MGELGSRLVRAREARGLTLEDAERDTRISRRYLEALESEQFENIPAPVYARGFLRSYSQYLGMDPQEMLNLFPRDDDGGRPGTGNGTPSLENPVSAVSQSRPSWPERTEAAPARRPEPAPIVSAPQTRPAQAPRDGRPQQQQPARSRAAQQGGPAAPRPQQKQSERELTIGVDIGVPAPARRIKPDSAANARTMTVLAVAGVAVIAVILAALLISNLGGDDSNTPPGSGTPGSSATAGASATTTQATSGLTVTPGVVPDVRGQTVTVAALAIQEAGFVARENHKKDTAPKGQVIDQSAAGTSQPLGSTIIIVVSDGP